MRLELYARPTVLAVLGPEGTSSEGQLAAVVVDDDESRMAGVPVTVRVEQGALTSDHQTYSTQVSGRTGADGIFRFFYLAEYGGAVARPGAIPVTAFVPRPDGPGLVTTLSLTVVGPPAALTLAASPISVTCGEVVTIALTVKDAAGQSVADGQEVEFWTNIGGRLAPPVARTSSGTAVTFLITSRLHESTYVVIARAKYARREGQGVMAQVAITARRNSGSPYGASPESPTHTSGLAEMSATQSQAAEGGRVDATTTVMFTDIVDSSESLEQVGDLEWWRRTTKHNEVLRASIGAHGGREIKKTGDGLMVSFNRATAAVEAAIQMQRSIQEMNTSSGQEPVLVKIGMHSGEPVEHEGDLVGRAPHLAARIVAQAGPGEILVSDTVRELVAGEKNFKFGPPRQTTLKGFQGPFTLVPVKWQEQ